jgi:hypothetical protein
MVSFTWAMAASLGARSVPDPCAKRMAAPLRFGKFARAGRRKFPPENRGNFHQFMAMQIM